MNESLINLLVFVAVIILVWIGYKLISSKKLLQTKLKREKTLTEDILKQLFHVEDSKTNATLDNLAGALQLKKVKILPVIEGMAVSGLVSLNDNKIALTESGRQYALRIVRVHRLWEKYLAERTGHHPREWHNLAEKMEHQLNVDQALKLESSLGNPMFDPHGDPIPNQMGPTPFLFSEQTRKDHPY